VRRRRVDAHPDDLDAQCGELIEQAVELNGYRPSAIRKAERVPEVIEASARGVEPEN